MTSRFLLSGVAALALLVGAEGAVLGGFQVLGASDAFAQDQGNKNQNQGAGQGNGSDSQGNQGGNQQNRAGQSDATASDDDGGGEDSDGKGPQAGQPTGDQGGKPVWAQEGIPEIELGRLNVIRSPQHVLDRALGEVVNNFNPATMEDLYESSSAGFIAEISANWDTVSLIDSPLENLALLSEYWTTGTTSLPGVAPASMADFSAILIGSASDKNIPVSVDTVTALAAIIGVDLSSSAIATIAAKAEDVRIAILFAHG